MAEHDIAHLVLAPPQTLEQDLVVEVAAIIGKDPYDARFLLRGNMPRMAAHYDSMPAAESAASSLRALGLVAFACGDTELRRTSPGFRPHTLEFGRGEVLFRDRAGQSLRLETGDVFLVLQGTAQTRTETEATSARMKFSLTGTVLTGGIPIWRRVTEKTSEPTVRAQGFVRLYGPRSSQPLVEMRQHDLNYSFIGADMAPTSAANFDTLRSRLKEAFPQAVFDDRLLSLPGAAAPFAGARDEPEINCKLLYMYHRAACGSAGNEGTT